MDFVKRPDGFRRDDLFMLSDFGQRVALAVETNRLTSDLEETVESLVGEVQRLK